jgi:hypothetical protein
VHLPDLTLVKNTDVKTLRDYIYAERRKARKEATKLISKEPKLRDAWMTSLGTGSEEVKAEASALLEREVMCYPEVFLKYAWANALTSLENALQGELIERSKQPIKKKG